MMAFICLFFPAMFAVALERFVSEEKISTKSIIFRFVFYTIAINLIVLIILTFGFNNAVYDLEDLYTVAFSMKYLGIASVLAILISLIMVPIKRIIKK